MAKSENSSTQENASVNKQEVLKLLISNRDKLSKAEPSRELSLTISNLDNAIYWLKQEL